MARYFSFSGNRSRGYHFRDRVPEKEKYLAIATYYSNGPGADRKKAADAYEAVLRIDSMDLTAGNNLASNLSSRRQYARAESLYVMLSRTRPSQISMGNYAGMLVSQGKVAQAESVWHEMERQFPASLTAQEKKAR